MILSSVVNQIGPLAGLVWLFLILILIGSIIIWFVGAIIFFIPALVVAAIVYYLTQNDTLAGLAFLLVALSSLTRPRRR